jgi:hypothetical protein
MDLRAEVHKRASDEVSRHQICSSYIDAKLSMLGSKFVSG